MRAGDREAFLDFASTRTSALLRMAAALTGDRNTAEDLVQTSLEKMVSRWGRLEDPEAYARRVIYNEYVSWWRHPFRRSEQLRAELPESRSDLDHASAVALQRDLELALRVLAPRQRAVVVMRYLDDRTEQEVAAILGCSVSTVSSQLTRALARLRTMCPELTEDPPEADDRKKGLVR